MASENGSGGAYTQTLDVDALIIGAGFGGAYLLHILRKLDLNVKVFEAGKEFGGVWNWNRYPGARVDCEVPYYGYSDAAIWSTYHFPERYPDHNELRNYFKHVDNVWDLSKDVSFNTTVVDATFQEQENRWLVKTADGRSCKCTYLLGAVGTSFKQHIPDWKGKEKFKGELHHSAVWPELGVDMKGKRVAVIGAGSSGIQIVQDAAKEAAHLTQFIRTPNFATPMRQRQLTDAEFYHHKSAFPHVFKGCRTTHTGLPIIGQSKSTFEVSAEEREKVWEEQYKRGGFNFQIGAFRDYLVDKDANRVFYDFWAKKTRARISDPVKRDLLVPEEAPYFMGTKRPSLEQDYYEMIDQPHVRIENSPILEIAEEGIVTKEGLHKFDVIAVATGFDAVTGGLRTLGIRGRGGVDLEQKWRDGVRTHLGIMMNGFPNFFMVYGPQAPTSFTNGPPFIEMQCEWIRDAIVKLREENLITMESKQEAEDAWRKETLAIADMTLAINTDSWYMGANIPGKKREMLLYLGGIPRYENACRDALEDWKSFSVQSAA